MEKGQVKLSFGMIFSIILIIVFIAFAFFAIQKFLGLGETISVGKFTDDIQSDVNKLWKRSQGSQEKVYSVPSGIEQVCFINFLEPKRGAYEKEDYYDVFKKYSTNKNLFFYPVGSTELNGVEIKHIEIGGNNPDCFEVKNGNVKIGIKKDFGEALVSVTGFSVSANLPITGNGILEEPFTLSLNGGDFQLIAHSGTGMFVEDGSPLDSFSMEVIDVSLDSSYSNVVGNVVYDMQPDGANFDSPINIQISYDEADIPDGISENDLIVMQKSNGVEKVVDNYYVDTVNNVVTASIEHFSSVWISVSNEGAVELVQFNDAGTAGAFVGHLYESCLGRHAEVAGYLGWRNALNRGELNAKQVVRGFVLSQEFQNKGLSNESFVTVLYNCTLGRELDTIGYESHLAGLVGGLSREEVLLGFLNSPEFLTYCSSYNANIGCDGDVTATATPTSGTNTTTTSGTARTKCSPVQLNWPGGTSGWNFCKTTIPIGENVEFDHTGAGCRKSCGELGKLSWGMWSWDGESESTCWCGDGTLTKTHCTFRAGTCEVSTDQRDCRGEWFEHPNNYMTISWDNIQIVKLDGWRTADKKYYKKYYDSGGYRFTKGMFIESGSLGGEDNPEIFNTYEACRRLLTEIKDCEWNSDCTDYCHNEEGVENGYCSDKKCYCTS